MIYGVFKISLFRTLNKLVLSGLALGCLWVAASASAQVEPVITYQYYPVTPEAGRSLYRQLYADTPLIRPKGGKTSGRASYSIKYNLKVKSTTLGLCRVRSLEVTCPCKITLPQLQSEDPALKSDFNAYLALLKDHELTHCRISAIYAGRFKEAALALDERPCEAIKNDVRAIYQQMKVELDREQDRFDYNTGLGGYQSRKAKILLDQPKRSPPTDADGAGLGNLPEPDRDAFWTGPAEGDPEPGVFYKGKDGVWRNY